MKDVVGRELKVGSRVVTTRVGYTHSLVTFYVTGFTTHKVKLERGDEQLMKYPEQVAVVDFAAN